MMGVTGDRRGSALLGVLVLVTIGSLIGTGVLLAVDAQQASASASLREDQARALAWSGVQGVMSELGAQREDLLAGLRPELTGEWVLFSDDVGRAGVVRLIPFDDGSLAQAESGKIDLNHMSEDVLGRLRGLSPELAGRIVAMRELSAFTSVEEILGVEGVTAAMLYGGEDPLSQEALGGGAHGLWLYGGQGERLLDRLTVFSFDPNVQAGLDDERHGGKLRLNFDAEWSDELADAVEDRFGSEAVEAVRQLFASGTSFASDADLCQVLNRLAPGSYEVWRLALDALTTSDDMYRPGRVDLNAASEAVLATIPGFDAEIAQQIVSARESLEDDERQSVVWPLERGIVTAERFIQAVDSLTTRSLQYRVRIEAGWRRADDEGLVMGPAGGGSGEIGGESDDVDALEHRRVLEAVIDVASTRARVAYLRDVTMMPVASAIAAESETLLETLEGDGDPFGALEEEALEERGERAGLRGASGLADEGEADAMLGGIEGFDEAEGGAQDGQMEEQEDEGRRTMERSAERPVRDDRGEEIGEDGAGDGERPVSGGSGGLMMIDRRIGRWTSRRVSG